MKNVEILSHYTQFPVLLGILLRKKIVFGNPKYWEDKTDSEILTEYAGAKQKEIRVLCLTEFPNGIRDNILHWKVYAPSKSGCRIDFDKKILKQITKQQNAVLKKVAYISTDELKAKPNKKLANLLFLKRIPYIYENEWRILWKGNLEENSEFELNISKIPLSNLIKCVRLSPELSKNVAESICAFLNKRYKIKTVSSWIFQNPNWKRQAKKFLPTTIGDKK